MRPHTTIALITIAAAACGGPEDLGSSTEAARLVEYALVVPLLDCATAEPDAVVRLPSDTPATGRVERTVRRRTCEDALVLAVHPESDITRITIESLETSVPQERIVVVFGGDGRGGFEPIAVLAPEEPGIDVEASGFKPFVLASGITKDAAGPGFWDYRLEERGVVF